MHRCLPFCGLCLYQRWRGPRTSPYEESWRWTLDYERDHYAFSEGGRAVVDALLDDFAARLPAPLRPFGRQVLLAAMDDRLRSTHHLPSPRPGADSLLAVGGRAFFRLKSIRPKACRCC